MPKAPLRAFFLAQRALPLCPAKFPAMTLHQTITTDTAATSTPTASVPMTGAEIVVRALVDNGVDVLFGYPGGAVLPIYDALFHEPRLRHVLVRHEQGATHAAEGYARSTGKCGVVLVTSGPGATNAVTGIVDALMDSIPLVVLTGQVPTSLIGSDAFQECDTVGITRSATKHNVLVRRVEDLPRALHEAFRIATTGRPGPVLVDIPKDVQFAMGTYRGPDDVAFAHAYAPQIVGDPARIQVSRPDRPRQPTDPLHRRGGDQCRTRRQRGPARVRRPDRRACDLHPDGAWSISGQRLSMAWHGGDARRVGSQPRHARLRRDGLHRRALR